jgi:methyl-accepting chemotaxis protein
MVAALAAAAFGCVGGPQRGPDPGKQDVGATADEVVRDQTTHALTYAELEELTRAYADRYMTLVNMATEAVERDNPAIEQRREANRARVVAVTSMYDIATNPDPFTRLLDMLIVVTLQSQVLIDDAVADEWFGERAQHVVTSIRRAREDIWRIAARVLTPEQLQAFDLMVWEWHRAHPQLRHVAFVRFDDFGASRGKSMVAAAGAGGGLLAPLNRSMQTIDEVRLLAERAFYLSKRAPIVLSWTAKSMLYDALADPQVRQLMSDYHDMAQAAKSAAGTLAELPDRITAEREHVERALDENAGNIGKIISDYRAAVAETHELVGSVNEVFRAGERIAVELKTTSEALTVTVDAVDRTLARYDPATGTGKSTGTDTGTVATPPVVPSRPFDIGEYTAAAQELTRAITELNRLVQSTSGLLEAEEWTTRIEEIDALGARQLDRAHDKGRFVIDRAYYRALWLVGIAVGGLILHAIVWSLLRRRTVREGSAPRRD